MIDILVSLMNQIYSKSQEILIRTCLPKHQPLIFMKFNNKLKKA
jgi:hypothetical protein